MYASAPKPHDLMKAAKDQEEQEKVQKAKIARPKSAFIEPLNAMGVMGTRTNPSSIPDQTLRRMAKVPPIAAILFTRMNQAVRFTKRPRFDGDTGFEIGLKEERRKMTRAEEKEAKRIEEFFLRTGIVLNSIRKDNFAQFFKKILYDSLVLDRTVWENVYNRKGELVEVWAVDASTIELVANAPTGELDPPPVYVPVTKRGIPLQGRIAYIQRVNGQITAEYTEEELAYGIRNPRTDLDYVDFGMSELEVLIEIVTGILNGIRYNTTYFTHSYLPQGVLELVGKYDDEHLEAFKRHWQTLTTGAAGKWSVPIMALEEGNGFKFTPFKNSNKDMEFNEFLEFLFNLTCAVYQIDPNEVGFKSWTSSNSMSQSDNTEQKIEHSLDKGFYPLMSFFASMFQTEIVDRINPEFEFRWVGLDEEDEDRKLERIEKRLTMGLTTVAEERARADMDEILGEDGKPALWTQAPANSTLIQVFMNDLQMKQQEHQAQLEEQKAQNDHGRALEQAEHAHHLEEMKAQNDHVRQMELAKHQQGLDDERAEADHNRALEQKEHEHKLGLEAAKHEHKLNEEAAESEHHRELARGEAEHWREKERAEDEHHRELARGEIQHWRDKEKAESAPTGGKKPKKNLRKSLNDGEAVLEIEISWDDY